MLTALTGSNLYRQMNLSELLLVLRNIIIVNCIKLILFCKTKFERKNMKKNLGTADKIIRVIIAVVIGLLYFTNVIAGTLGIVLLVIAGVFLLTSIVGFCPLYAPFGINTCPSKR